jgi:hypothetical protein
MALKKNIETLYGFIVNNAYIKVESVNVVKNKITFSVNFYVDNSKPFFDSKVYACNYDIQSDNPICQAYKHLKTLPEFEGATDC